MVLMVLFGVGGVGGSGMGFMMMCFFNNLYIFCKEIEGVKVIFCCIGNICNLFLIR